MGCGQPYENCQDCPFLRIGRKGFENINGKIRMKKIAFCMLTMRAVELKEKKEKEEEEK